MESRSLLLLFFSVKRTNSPVGETGWEGKEARRKWLGMASGLGVRKVCGEREGGGTGENRAKS